MEYSIFLGVSIKLSVFLIKEINQLPIFRAIIACYLSESAAFLWNILDIFIMIIGIGLTMHFKVFNSELEKAKAKIEVKLEF